jgi:hypothetical protein
MARIFDIMYDKFRVPPNKKKKMIINIAGFEVPTAVTVKGTVFWVETACSLPLLPYICFLSGLLFEYEHGGDPFLRNIGKLLPNYTSLQPRRQ